MSLIYPDLIDLLLAAFKSAVPRLAIYEPGSAAPTPPALVLQSPDPTINYNVGFESVEGDYGFEALLIFPASEPKVSKRRLAELISPDSDLIAAIHDIRDDNGASLFDCVSGLLGDATVGSGTFPSALIEIVSRA